MCPPILTKDELLNNWESTNPRWSTQQQVLLKPLKSARVSLKEAIYSISTLVIPKLKYTLQVASIPKNLLRRIDSSLRSVVNAKILTYHENIVFYHEIPGLVPIQCLLGTYLALDYLKCFPCWPTLVLKSLQA